MRTTFSLIPIIINHKTISNHNNPIPTATSTTISIPAPCVCQTSSPLTDPLSTSTWNTNRCSSPPIRSGNSLNYPIPPNSNPSNQLITTKNNPSPECYKNSNAICLVIIIPFRLPESRNICTPTPKSMRTTNQREISNRVQLKRKRAPIRFQSIFSSFFPSKKCAPPSTTTRQPLDTQWV